MQQVRNRITASECHAAHLHVPQPLAVARQQVVRIAQYGAMVETEIDLHGVDRDVSEVLGELAGTDALDGAIFRGADCRSRTTGASLLLLVLEWHAPKRIQLDDEDPTANPT